jgi:hypothetical protein
LPHPGGSIVPLPLKWRQLYYNSILVSTELITPHMHTVQ